MRGQSKKPAGGVKLGVFEENPGVGKCEACGVAVVWARDDRFPEKDLGELINVEPNPKEGRHGNVVLWFEVTNKGKPVGKQWFRFISHDSGYTGEIWNRHIETCSNWKGGDVRTV